MTFSALKWVSAAERTPKCPKSPLSRVRLLAGFSAERRGARAGGAGVGSLWVVRMGARWVLGCDREGHWRVPMHWGQCQGGYRNEYQRGEREVPARRVDTGVDNGGWVRGCRCPEMPVRRVDTGMGTELGTELVPSWVSHGVPEVFGGCRCTGWIPGWIPVAEYRGCRCDGVSPGLGIGVNS